MIKPPELDSRDAWETLVAAERGDAGALRALLARDPGLHGSGYWYTPPLHFAVREGHAEAVQVLLEAGADPTAVIPVGDDLLTMARDRGHTVVARLLEDALSRRPQTRPAPPGAPDPPIHAAAADDDVERVREMLDADPSLVGLGDRKGGTPLHRAVAASARGTAALLLDRGADIHARHGAGAPDAAGYAPAEFEPIDLALWRGPGNARGDVETARLLLDRGATHDLVVAAALGEQDHVRALLDADPRRIAEARPSGQRALSAAVELGHGAIARLLLERGADPNWPDGPGAPRGRALYVAARAGDRAMVELLLDHGADPNSELESSGTPTYAAKTRELRALLLARGGVLSTYDLVWLDEDDEAVRRVAADPRSADDGCGGVLAAACTRGKRDLLVRLLDAGARVPPVLTACRSYLLEDPDMLRLLLASGMDPDLPNWLRATPLHDLCGRDSRGRPHPRRTECAAVLLDAGATISARDDDYRSTPLAWAARNDLPEMVELLLARGAPSNLPDDEPWATPLAWASRRGHTHIVETLRRAGAAR
jgi:ankyrin repeat protein